MAKQVVIIGGGAAGFFCAINLAVFNADVCITLLEKQNKVLQKVKVSGGGRCNATHACFQASALIKKYPRGKNFLKKAFALFSVRDTIDWFEKRGVLLKTESDGRMFPSSNNSQSIIDCLLNEASKQGVNVQLKTEVVKVEKNGHQFTVTLHDNSTMRADYIFVAAGGFPKISQYDWMKYLGHHIIHPVPSLFTFNMPHANLRTLMGVVVENAIAKIEGSKLIEQGPVLITHWGLSGPAILRLSAWGARDLQALDYKFNVIINWLGIPENEIRLKWNTIRERQGAANIITKNPFLLPSRLWEYLLNECAINIQTKWSELPSKDQNKLIHILTTHTLAVEGKTTFKEEFVTCGGIDLDEVEASTMESKLVTNLFFGGEVLDVDGITGGFNFQHAWSSAYIGAKAIAQKSKP